MPHRTCAGVDARHTWNGDGRQAQVYGGRIAHRFETGAGVGITASLSGAGGSMRGDSSAMYLSGFVAASRTLPGLDDQLSAFASLSFEVNGVDVPTHGERGASTRSRWFDEMMLQSIATASPESP